MDRVVALFRVSRRFFFRFDEVIDTRVAECRRTQKDGRKSEEWKKRPLRKLFGLG
jgi:Leu/Phe-tRNA-protein transferase